MTILPMTSVAYEIGISGIGDHNTVSNGPDDGANANLACAFWNCMRHNTTEQAVSNLLSRLGIANENTPEKGSGACNIAGHGNHGFLTTGCGQTGEQDYRTNYITTWNQFAWQPFLSQLTTKNFPWLKIWSCHTGSGEDGADLLFAIARVIGKPVQGNTGFLYSNSKCKVWQENGAVWQVATPDNRPDPIEPPSPHFLPIIGEMTDQIAIAGQQILISNLANVTFEFISHELAPRTHTISDPGAIQALAKEVAATQQFELPGLPAAFVTARIRLSDKDGSSNIDLQVFNDRLVTDSKTEVGFYVGPVLGSMMKTFRGTR